MTQISNNCEEIRQRKWDKIAQPMFAFQRIACEKKDSESVGIGLSTAHALAKALQGSVGFSIDAKEKMFVCGLKVRFETSPDGGGGSPIGSRESSASSLNKHQGLLRSSDQSLPVMNYFMDQKNDQHLHSAILYRSKFNSLKQQASQSSGKLKNKKSK